MPHARTLLRRLLRRAGFLAFAVLLGAGVGLVSNARAAQPAGDGHTLLVAHDADVAGAR